jgi:hypothetical protein
MAREILPYSLSHHPAPHRERISIGAILYGVFIGGIVWAGHLMLNFALTVHACYPGDIPLARANSGAHWAWPLILALDIVGLALIASGVWVSYRCWAATGQESEGHHHRLMEVGEGRTRFLGIVGMAFSAMFFLVTLTDTTGLFLVPICAM